MTKTKRQLTKKIEELTSLGSAAVLGLGVGLIISIIFTKIGVWLVLAGLAIKVFGTALSRVLPHRFDYRPVTCPYCRQVSQVRSQVTDFNCDNCARALTTENNRVKLHRHLKLVVNNKAKTFGKPVLKDPDGSGQKLKGSS